MLARAAGTPYKYSGISFLVVLISSNSLLSILFFLASALAWDGAAMHLQYHCFWLFSWPAPLLGKHIITEFIQALFVSIKATMDLLSIAISLQLRRVYFLFPSKQSSGKSSIYGFGFGRRE